MLGRKRCPRCDERVRAAAKVCRYCGADLSSPAGPGPAGVQVPAPQPVPAAPEFPSMTSKPEPAAPALESTGGFAAPQAPDIPPQVTAVEREPGLWSGMPWYRSWWLRGPVLALFVLDAGLRVESAWHEDGVFAERLVIGALAVLIGGLAFWGLVIWAGGRLFKQRWRYGRIVTSYPLIIAIWVSSLGTAMRADKADTQEVNDRAAAAAQGDPQAQRQAAFSDWFTAYLDAVPSRKPAGDEYVAWSDAKDPVSNGALRHLRRSVRRARAHEAQTLKLPDTGDTAGPTRLLQEQASDLRRCLTRTLTIMSDFDNRYTDQAARAADRLCARSDRRIKQAARDGDRVYKRLGGAQAFPDVAERIQELVAQHGSQ